MKTDLAEVTAQRDELLAALKDLLTAAEIVDGCETPDASDTEHLIDQFARSHKLIAKAEASAQS